MLIKVVKKPLGDQCGVASIVQDALRVREGEDGKAIKPVQVSDGRLQELGAFRVAVAGDQDDLLVLASLPDNRVRGVPGQIERGKGLQRAIELDPEVAPGFGEPDRDERGEEPFDVVVSQDSPHNNSLARLVVFALAPVPGTWRGQRRAGTGERGGFPWQPERGCAGTRRALPPHAPRYSEVPRQPRAS